MAVYVAVYVLPSWIENMLTDWGDFAHAQRRTHRSTRVQANNMCQCERTQTHLDGKHTPEQLKMNKNIILSQSFFFFRHQIHFLQGCPRVRSFSFVRQLPTWSYWSSLWSIHQLTRLLLTARWSFKWTSVSMPRVARSTDTAISSLPPAIALRYL